MAPSSQRLPKPVISPTHTAALFLLIAFTTFAQTVPQLFSAFSRWSAVEQTARDSVFFPAIFAAVFAVGRFRVFSANNVIVGKVSARPSSYLARINAAAMLAAILPAYLTGMLPLIIKTALYASWLNLNIAAVLAALAELAMLSGIGMAVALLLPSRWSFIASPLAVAAGAVFPVTMNNTVFNNTGHSTLAISPVWMMDLPGLGYTTSLAMNVLRALSAIFIGVALARFMRHYLDADARSAYARDAIFDSAIVCAVAIAVWSIVVPSQIFAAHNAVLECTAEGEDVTVCVHPADRSARAEIVKTVRRVFSLAPQRKSVLFIEGMSDSSLIKLNQTTYTPNQIFTMNNAVISSVEGDESRSQLQAALYDDLIRQVVASPARCPSRSESGAGAMILAVQTAMRLRLGLEADSGMIDESTGRELVDGDSLRLARLSEKDFRNWYIAHRDEIQACTIASVE